MAVVFVPHSPLRLAAAPAHPKALRRSFCGFRFESHLYPCLSTPAGAVTAALGDNVSEEENHLSAVDSFSSSLAEELDFSSGSDSEEPSRVPTGKRGRKSANEPLGAAASVLPGGSYRRLKINLDLLLYRAKVALKRGKVPEAQALLKECIRDWPDDGRSYVILGKWFSNAGKLEEAKKLYEYGCQAAGGENAFIWQNWAVLEAKCGNFSRARSLFDAATIADSKHAAAWHGWAVLELRSKDFDKSRYLLNKGLKLCGDNDYFYQTMGILEVKTGNIGKARAAFAKAVQTNPKSAPCWLAWALMEAEFGYTQYVRKLFQRGLESAPRRAQMWQAWATFEARQGNRGKARELFQRGTELCPKDVIILQAYGLFEYDCGQLDIARRHFRRAALIDPKHQPLWLGWGWVEWKEGNHDAARQYYRKALMINSRNASAARAYQSMGVLEGSLGNHALARALFNAALTLEPQGLPIWAAWVLMEERCGNLARAEELRVRSYQQCTRLVGEAVSWDVDAESIITPTVDGFDGMFKNRRQNRPEPEPFFGRGKKQLVDGKQLLNDTLRLQGDTPPNNLEEDDFDVRVFLERKFPEKYTFNKFMRRITIQVADE